MAGIDVGAALLSAYFKSAVSRKITVCMANYKFTPRADCEKAHYSVNAMIIVQHNLHPLYQY